MHRLSHTKGQNGFALLAMIVILALSAILVAGGVSAARSNTRAMHNSELRGERFYNVEAQMGSVVSWMRENSESLVSPFNRDNFYNTFERTSPSAGANEGKLISLATKIKLKSSNDAAILANDSYLATATFPNTTHIVTNAAFNPVSSFQGTTFGEGLVRLTLIDALPVDPTKDFGAPPNPAPDTDFNPVYRVDSYTGTDQASHVFGYIIGSMYYVDAIGFYGKDFVELRQKCDSYISANGTYSSTSKRARCPIGSDANVRIHDSEILYGSARTNGSIDSASPWGGDVCSDFQNGCPNEGTTCQGASCSVPGLPTLQTYAAYCPSNQGNLTVSANTTLTVPGNAANQKCWNTVSINSNRTLTLTSTVYPYYFKTLTYANNSNSRVNIQPSPSSGTVRMYVETITGDSFNGNMVMNGSNRPVQFRMYYLGSNPLTLNGSAAMNVAMVAPNADVTVAGNFTYQGGIIAKSLTFTGSGDVHYDESLGGQTLTDSNYRIKNEIQYYQ